MKVNNKELILKELKSRTSPISGEELSSIIGISRTGVWKHIKSLTNSGYEIVTSHGGYLLKREDDLLLPYEFSSDSSLIIHNQSTTSTMDRAYELISKAKVKDGTIVLAESQSSGFGRNNSAFNSPKGGLYFTIINLPKSHASDINLYPIALLLSINSALNTELNLQTELKWPMEIWCSEKKICGIIHEYQIRREHIEWISIGAGINTNIEPHRKEVLEKIRENYIELKKDLDSVFSEYKKLTGITHIDRLGTIKNIQNNRQEFEYICSPVKKDTI